MLVQAGASGSGSMAIQVAKALGADVITTVSTDKKAALARSIGADEVVRYRETDVSATVRGWAGPNGIDVVIDPVGGTTMATNLECLKPRGTVVNFGLSGGAAGHDPASLSLLPQRAEDRRRLDGQHGRAASSDSIS